ncbi:MAG: hypothetical protein IPN76_31210 [Saprospiraceae bacterium]|jgi:hypothetical protein|nr:hypothetical protein [Saprospiraceae bacterium]
MEQKKEVKPEMMPKSAKEQAIQEGRKLLDQNLTTEEKFSSPKPENDNNPKRQRAIAEEKPPSYDLPVPISTPNVKDKNKGRSL